MPTRQQVDVSTCRDVDYVYLCGEVRSASYGAFVLYI